ncbi:uncharacterized protein LOC120286586 [Eucalyptus grandis]|uniref:uncharacterized protein LOC120286586 n=1 Tax=Eucalyptus grandis TaxID=71139 RepID=UPI00192EBB9D|nr:uncharacterized protein LOC120286586 [Eucalyptus grandis]
MGLTRSDLAKSSTTGRMKSESRRGKWINPKTEILSYGSFLLFSNLGIFFVNQTGAFLLSLTLQPKALAPSTPKLSILAVDSDFVLPAVDDSAGSDRVEPISGSSLRSEPRPSLPSPSSCRSDRRSSRRQLQLHPLVGHIVAHLAVDSDIVLLAVDNSSRKRPLCLLAAVDSNSVLNPRPSLIAPRHADDHPTPNRRTHFQ